MQTDIGCDVKSTSQIVKCNRTDSHKQDTLKVWLENLECAAIKSTAMSHVMIYIFSLFIKNSIGEIIIFVNNEVEMISTFFSLSRQEINLVL